MQSASKRNLFPVFSQLHEPRPIPQTFHRALRLGWKVVSEKTELGADKRHRHGTLTLRKDSQVITVPYTASVKLGYQFGKPQSR